MHVLLTAASKHGSTAEIAAAIGRRLFDEGMAVTAAEPNEVTHASDYDAVVVGSGVYAGHWLEPAKRFVERLRDQLVERQVWLFSSGPIGDPPVPREDAVEVAEIIEQTGAREHKVFAGCIDKNKLGFGEKTIVRALRVPVGDYRDWDDVSEWAAEIARALRSEARVL